LKQKPVSDSSLSALVRGEEVTITRHDKPVARLIPEGPSRLESVREAISEACYLSEQSC
jgi:antitoxin (DNA-binding transcriptional repressor) of toxin-antitoxin stability system